MFYIITVDRPMHMMQSLQHPSSNKMKKLYEYDSMYVNHNSEPL